MFACSAVIGRLLWRHFDNAIIPSFIYPNLSNEVEIIDEKSVTPLKLIKIVDNQLIDIYFLCL